MTPVYVSVIYLFLHSFPSETSPEHLNRVFSTCAVRKTKTLGTEWMLVVDWLIFRHGVFPAVKSNRVKNAPCDVTREILLNIIHTHQIKIRQKKLRNLSTPSAISFATKFHVFVIMSKATSQVFSSYQRNRTVLSFRERYRLTVLYQTNCGYDGTERGFTKCDLIVTKITKLFFFFIWAVIDFLTTNISWFLLNIKQHPSPISRKPQTILNVRMAWIICIVLFCITSVFAGFYSGNSRNIQNTSWRLVKKIFDTYYDVLF